MIRKRLKRWAIVFAAVLLIPAVLADEIKAPEAIAAAETWVRHVTADAREEAEAARIDPHLVDGKTVAYIVHLDDGYCICGADDRLLPVYLYNASGAYDPANPNYQCILDEIATRYAKIKDAAERGDPVLDQYRDMLNERAMQWRELSARRVPPPPEQPDGRADPSLMTLPLTCYWKQGSPFNDYCPELTPGADEHTVVGCVATAMAQTMYYWQWPPSGVGSGSGTYHYRYEEPPWWLVEPLANDPGLPGHWNGRLEWHSTNGGELQMTGYWDDTIYEGAQDHSENSAYRTALNDLWSRMNTGSTGYSANPGTATYNWGSMRDVASDPPSTGDLEAAEISYHAGVMVGMDYGLWGSSAFTSNTPWIYKTWFSYDDDVYYVGRSESAMIEEIRWFRPVQLRGSNNPGGHSWNVAGYNTNVSPTQFLMNMGWGGGTTDWYTCDDVFPNGQGHAIRIAPESVVRFVGGGGLFADGSPDDPYINIDYAVSGAPDETTLVFKAGSTHTLSGGVIDKPLTLKGYDVTIEAAP